MDEDDINEKNLLAEYGRFISFFEMTCFALRLNIKFLIFNKSNFTSPEIENLNNILLEGLTAEPLAKKFLGLFVFRFPDDKNGISITKKLFDVFTQNIIPIRNSLSHGLTSFKYNIENMSSLEMNQFSLTHPKITSKGLEKRHKIISLDNLKLLNENMKEYNFILSIIQFMKEDGENSSNQEANEIIDKIGKLKFKLEEIKISD